MTDQKPLTLDDFDLSREGDVVTIACEKANHKRDYTTIDIAMALDNWKTFTQNEVMFGKRKVDRRIWIQVLERAVKL